MALKRLYSGVEPKLCSSPELVPGVKMYIPLRTLGCKQAINIVGRGKNANLVKSLSKKIDFYGKPSVPGTGFSL